MKRRFFACHIAAALLILSWVIPGGQTLWHHIDRACYDLLSPLLTSDRPVRLFWAFWNSRVADWLHDVVIALFFARYIISGPKRRRFAEMVTAVAIGIASITVVNHADFLRFDKESPAKLFDLPHLAKETPGLSFNEISSSSFPSDHAVTGILFAAVIAILMGRRAGAIAALYAIAFFALPRLTIGGHWLSDIVVGSGSIALIIIGWCYGTPFATRIADGIEWLIARTYEPTQSQ